VPRWAGPERTLAARLGSLHLATLPLERRHRSAACTGTGRTRCRSEVTSHLALRIPVAESLRDCQNAHWRTGGFRQGPLYGAHWTSHPPGFIRLAPVAWLASETTPVRTIGPGSLRLFGRSGHQVEGRLCFLRVSRAVRSDLIGWGVRGERPPGVVPLPGGCFRVSRLVAERVYTLRPPG